jgi:hypothetical protein
MATVPTAYSTSPACQARSLLQGIQATKLVSVKTVLGHAVLRCRGWLASSRVAYYAACGNGDCMPLLWPSFIQFCRHGGQGQHSSASHCSTTPTGPAHRPQVVQHIPALQTVAGSHHRSPARYRRQGMPATQLPTAAAQQIGPSQCSVPRQRAIPGPLQCCDVQMRSLLLLCVV